jgi:hypothetical protein
MVIKEAFNAMSDQIRQITESDFAACPAVNWCERSVSKAVLF